MGWFTRVFRPGMHDSQVGKSVEKDIYSSIAESGGVLPGNISGREAPNFNRTEIVSMYKRSPRFRGIVHRIAEAIAAAEWTLGFIQDEKAFQAGLKYKGALPSRHIKRVGDVKRRKQAKESSRFVTIDDHPLLTLLDNGNGDELDGYTVRKLHSIYMDIIGESFMLKVNNELGVPTELWPIPPHWISEVPTAKNNFYRLQRANITVASDKILWFKEADPANPYGRGSGIGESLGDELDTDEYAAKLVKAAFYNKGTPAGIVSLKGAKGDTVRSFQEKWNGEHRGFRNYGLVKFTNAESMSFAKIDNTFEELQLGQLRQEVRDIIQQVYGVPPEISGIIENSNRATIEAAAYIMAQFVTIPRLERERRMYDRKLVSLFDRRLILDYEDPTPESFTQQFEAAKSAPYNVTRNEYRTKFLGLDNVGEQGDVFYTPLNLIPEKLRDEGEPEPVPVIEEQPAPLALPEAEVEVEENELEDKHLCCEPMSIISTKTYDESKAMVRKQIDEVVNAVNPRRLTNRLEPIWSEELQEWGDEVLDDINIGIAFNIQNPAIADHLLDWTENRIKGLVNENTKDMLRESLAEGIADGEGADQLARRVRGIFIDDKARAVRIARTETIRSANFGTLEAYQQSGVVEGKKWIAALVNSRPEHIDLHNTDAPINEAFEVGGSEAMYPGGFGEPGLDINCMCVIVGVVDLQESASIEYGSERHETILKQSQVSTIPWETKAREALEKGFEEQAADVLEALNEELS